jgi:hypothetical protein
LAAFPVQGPVDIIEQGVSGYMDYNLETAVKKCLTLDRKAVKKASQVWTWATHSSLDSAILGMNYCLRYSGRKWPFFLVKGYNLLPYTVS